MMKKVFLGFIVGFLVVFCLLFFFGRKAHGQTLTFASQELANTFNAVQTFMAGIKLNGTTSGAVTIVPPGTVTTYTLVLPSGPGAVGQIFCVSGAPGQMGYCAPAGSGGFTAGGDLSGSPTSQKVTGLFSVPISSAPTTTGQVLKYNASTNQFSPGTCP